MDQLLSFIDDNDVETIIKTLDCQNFTINMLQDLDLIRHPMLQLKDSIIYTYTNLKFKFQNTTILFKERTERDLRFILHDVRCKVTNYNLVNYVDTDLKISFKINRKLLSDVESFLINNLQNLSI